MSLQDTIPQAQIIQFSQNVYRAIQQNQARTRPFVNLVPLNAKQLMMPRVGTVELQDITGRFPDIQFSDIEWGNRALQGYRRGAAIPIDEWDVQKMLLDPKAELVVALAAACERKFDRVVLEALLASVYTGEFGTTILSAASDGVVQVDATAGFTYNKLLEIDQKFKQVGVGLEMPERIALYITEQEHVQLMKEGMLVSGDFSHQYVIDKGGMTRALSFELIMYGSDEAGANSPMLKEAGGVRSCIAAASGAVTVGVTKQWDIKREPRNEKWDTDQLLAGGIMGATRMDGKKVIEVLTAAT